jgi:membrane protein YdbS with pleckstrin-like domain
MTIKTIIHQKDYEKIVYHLRRHPIIFLKDFFLFLGLVIVPIVFYIFMTNSFAGILESNLARLVLVILASIYYLSVILINFTQFVDYYLDNWIVTNDRVLNIEQHALFGRTMSELDLYNIQDVTSEIKGVLPTLFNYGNVHIQTAGEVTRFVFENVKNPHEIRDRLLDLAEDDRRYHANSPKP